MRRLWDRFLHGGLGVAFAVLLPRGASIVCQWTLSWIAGPAAVAAYVFTTSRYRACR